MRLGIIAGFAVALMVLSPTLAAKSQQMLHIAAGSFVMGSERGDADEKPRRKVVLAAFEIDRTEVTQQAYKRCVVAGICRAPVAMQARGDQLPVSGVSWSSASRYCAWLKKRLPTEAEWERAARGNDGRIFPWGAGLDCRKANFGNFDGDGPCGHVSPGRPVAVGSYPAGQSPSGAHDMAGNVWEWVADRYPRTVDYRVVRGGSCCSYFAMPTTSNRYRLPKDHSAPDVGFRCARSRPKSPAKRGRSRIRRN